jgi:hypothetical protein
VLRTAVILCEAVTALRSSEPQSKYLPCLSEKLESEGVHTAKKAA